MKCYKGTILTVDSDNPYTVPSESLKEIKVDGLILKGKSYESARTSLLRCIWKGITTSNGKY